MFYCFACKIYILKQMKKLKLVIWEHSRNIENTRLRLQTTIDI